MNVKPILVLLVLLQACGLSLAAESRTRVSIVEDAFHINERPTYAGRKWQGKKIEGLLLNSRMVQATFDDLNPQTRERWAYPDTGVWDAERNLQEFLAAMPEWRRHGLLGITVNLQGGSPQGYSKEQPWHNSAFTETGALRPEYTKRLEQVLTKADDLGMVVIVGYFYFGQDQRLKDEAAVVAATDSATQWLLRSGFRNVLIEVNNECDVKVYDHEVLKPARIHELIERARLTEHDGRRLLVGTSYGGGSIPQENVVQSSDFILLHGNGVKEPQRIVEMVRKTRNIPGYRPMPILFNEDDHFDFDRPINNFSSAIGEYVGWGFFDYRMKDEGFDEGYQSVPVNWGISSDRKSRFFKMLSEITGGPLETVGVINKEEKLVPGIDRISTPAIGTGLFVHNLFQSNMVIQRDKLIPIWGWATPNEKITVTFGDASGSSVAAADRSWKVELPAMPASTTSRTITVQGSHDTIELKNILVGDVWLLAGQSNMEFELHKLEEGPLEIISANFDQIRLFTVPQQNGPETRKSFPRLYQWNDFFSQHFRQGYWDVCSPETVQDMSGIGYIFGRRIHMAMRVPIGLLDVSRGGTTLMSWTPIDLLRKIDTPEVISTIADWDKRVAEFDPQKDLERRVKQHNDQTARLKAQGKETPANRKPPTDLLPGPATDMNRPGNLYASTLSTIAGLPVKGVLWHQGYNEALMPNGHKIYSSVFPEMIKAWRGTFNDPAMPLGIITQETQDQPQTLENFLPPMVDEGNYIREVHYKTFLNFRSAGDKNIGYASCFDQHRAWYHPQIKVPVGERIAKWALATQYGLNIRWLPPQLKEVIARDGKLFLKLDTWAIPFHDGPIQGFAIAGKEGRFQPAQAQWHDKNEGKGEPNWERSLIVLSSAMVQEPVYFRYAWARNPLENLKSSDNAGLPFDTQRNDPFSLADMYQIYTGKNTSKQGVLQDGERRELIQVLKAEDLKRRLDEARTLINNRENQ